MNKPFYVCTAIAYGNAPPHMGHAMEFIEADAIARYKRMMGFEVHYLTGTDEHGVKIFNTAQDKGLTPQNLVDQIAEAYKKLDAQLQISNDDFIRTSDRQRHWPACQKIWRKLVEAGDLYEKEYEGMYCEGCEAFYNEHDLTDGKCPHHGKAPVTLKEKNYFFKLSKYSEKIVELIKSDTLKIYPESRKHEFLNMAEEGLHDVSFSRPKNVLPWGVPVPDDDSQVMYVWCDALTNYISALDYANEGELYKKFWPADLHVIGKDIVRFHAGIWIGMLLSAEVPIPKGIFVHGFLTHNGVKMSKTLGNVVDPVAVADKYGTDALRYYLLREIPVGRDGDFNDKLFVERYNADLANNLGNLVNRVHTLVSRNEITEFKFDSMLETKVMDTWKKYESDMDKFNLHEAIFHVWRLIDTANKVMEDEKPWSLLREDRDKGVRVLCNLLELIRHVTMMISPYIPESAQKIRRIIGVGESFDLEKEKAWASLPGWNRLGAGEIVFPRIETEGEA